MEIMQLISKRRIFPVYQPIIDSESNTVFGYESLARGPGNIMPGSMFEEADRYGLIRNLDTLCLYNAIENTPNEKPLFVNILPFTLMWLIVSNKIERIINKAKGQIVFEIVEVERISSNVEEFIFSVERIKKLGFKIAIDDISQGFSRLYIIPSICPDYIKIDRTLTSNCTKNYNSIIKNVINIGNDVGAKIIAEGIETETEYRNLLSLGIQYYQGYYFAKPGEEYSPKGAVRC